MESVPREEDRVHDGVTDELDELERLKSRVETIEALADATLSALEASPLMGDKDGHRAYLLAHEVRDALGSFLGDMRALVERVTHAAAESAS